MTILEPVVRWLRGARPRPHPAAHRPPLRAESPHDAALRASVSRWQQEIDATLERLEAEYGVRRRARGYQGEEPRHAG